MSRSLNTEHGFTLIELITAIGISGIVLAAITATFISQSRSYDAQEQINGMQQAARVAMDMITREVRMAGYDPTGAGISGIVVCNATTIQVRADVTADGLTTGVNEDITYTFDDPNNQILRDGEILVENIALADFDCLVSTNPDVVAATVADILTVRITITARTAKSDPNYTANGGYRTYTLSSLITPRNLAY